MAMGAPRHRAVQSAIAALCLVPYVATAQNAGGVVYPTGTYAISRYWVRSYPKDKMTDVTKYFLLGTAFEYHGTVNANIAPTLAFSCPEKASPYLPITLVFGAQGSYFSGPSLRYRVDQADPKDIRFAPDASGSFIVTTNPDVNALVAALVTAKTVVVQVPTPLTMVEGSFDLTDMADDFTEMQHWCPATPLHYTVPLAPPERGRP